MRYDALKYGHEIPQPRKICIVGAGVSGLRAGGLLATAGLDVTLLEARDRVGGRVNQSLRFDLPIDLGPSWIHGTEGNPFVALARKAKVPTVGCGAVHSICNCDGTWLSRGTARGLYEQVWDILDAAIDKSQNVSADIHESATLMDFVREEARSRSTVSEMDPKTYEDLILKIAEMWGAFMGDDCERQSLKNVWYDAGLEGDNLFALSTYMDIIADLLSPVQAAAKIRLKCEVTNIQYHDGKAHITAADGFKDAFDSVILTMPLGWLKRNHSAFSPPIESRILKAIQTLGYGNLDRIFIRFSTAFWNDTSSTTQTQNKLGFPVESLFLSPEYATDTNPARWRTEIISLSGFPPPFAQPVIMFFVYGQWGRHITGLVRGMEQDSDEYCRILDEHFRPYYSKLPNYDIDSSTCRPLEFLSTDWQNDRLAGYGSFCNLPVGSGDCAEDIQALRDGMPDRGIWFAGEHVSPPGGLGTVTGAYWSGEEAAQKVAERYQVQLSI